MSEAPLFGRGGKVASAPQAPDAVEPEPEFTSPEWETWWLPAPVGAWVEAVSAALGTPKSMAIAAAMCAAATVTQGKAWVEIKPGWREPLSLYWLVFSPTGSRKSALLRLATAPIKAMQDARARELEPEIRRASNEKHRLEQQIARMRRATKAHRYTEGAQEHLQQLRELEHEHGALVVPKAPRWLYDDINPTMVPRKLKHNLEAEGIARVAVLDAEGTLLANILGRHSGQLNVDPYLKGYSGDPIDMVRAVHGSENTADTHLDAAHISLLLLVQPHYLDKLRREGDLTANGFLGRCLMTHLDHNPEVLDWDAPEVPEQVQAEYGRWLATLAALPEGTVYAMPRSVHGELRGFHERLERDRIAANGATGWIVRTLGRICRILALSELSETVRLSEPAAGDRARIRVISKLTYLISIIYTRGLAHARAVEPVSDPLARLSRRALRWLRQSDSVKIGSIVTVRALTRALTVPKDRALAVADSLVSDGYLEQLPEVRRANQTLTVSYRVLTLEPGRTDATPPVLLAVSAELDEPAESAPEPADYLGDEDFEPPPTEE